MAARARQFDGSTHSAAAPAPRRPRTASLDDCAAPSPALMLQQALAAEILPDPDRKWHPAASLAFVVLTCGGFWATVAVVVARAF